MKTVITTLMFFALLMFACGEDEEKEPTRDAGDQIEDGGIVAGSGGTSGSGGSGGTSGSGGSSTEAGAGGSGGTDDDDSGVVEPDMDGGSVGDGSVQGDGSAAEDADQADTAAPPVDLPDPGEPLSLCTDNSDCTRNTDDLTCYRAAGEDVGFCTEDCVQDSHCQAIDGLTATCVNGACVVVCESAEDTNCPENMQCLPARRGAGIEFGCGYSEDVVQPSQQLFEICSLDSECSDDLVCYRPGAASGSEPGSGYCTNECQEVEDCESPEGVDVVMACSGGGHCRILCDATEDCPDGMECQSVQGEDQQACWYP
jgi:hypothetical protein